MTTLKLTQARRDLILQRHKERYELRVTRAKQRHDSLSKTKFNYTLLGLIRGTKPKEAKALLLEAITLMTTRSQWLSPQAILELTDRHKVDVQEVRQSRLLTEQYLRSMERKYTRERKALVVLLTMSDTVPTKELTKLLGKHMVKNLRLVTKEKS